jgi:sugar lactone lactonase YvrE
MEKFKMKTQRRIDKDLRDKEQEPKAQTVSTRNAGSSPLRWLRAIAPLMLLLVGAMPGAGQIYVLSESTVSGYLSTAIDGYTISGAPLFPNLANPGGEWEGIAYAANPGVGGTGPRLYATDYSGGRVDVWDTSGTVKAAPFVTGLGQPIGIAVYGSLLFVVGGYASGGDVQEFDAVKGTHIGSLGSVPYPQYLAVSADALGDLSVFVTSANNGTGTGPGSVFKFYIPTSGGVMTSTLCSGVSLPQGIAVSADGSRVYVASYDAGLIVECDNPPGPAGSTAPWSNLVTGLASLGPVGIAVSGGDLFVTMPSSGTTVEYTPAGVKVGVLISGLNASGIAVAPSPGSVEICKASSPTNPVAGTFRFTVTGTDTSGSVGQPILAQVPVGDCSGPIQVSEGFAAITETPRTGVSLNSVVASGYDPTTGLLGNRLPASSAPNLAAGKATVTVVGGNVSVETVATFTNQGPPVSSAGQLKICKIAGAGVGIGTNFNFTATATSPAISQNYTVPAGPAAEGGYCVIDSSTFPVRTNVTVTEVVPTGYAATSAVAPAGTTGGSTISVTLGAGFTEVTFTNRCLSKYGCFFPVSTSGLSFTGFSLTAAITQLITVASTSPVPFTVGATTASGPAGWLTVTPLQGTTPATLTVSVAPLPVGTYLGAITIASSDPSNPLSSTLPVTYVVAASSGFTSLGSMAQLAFAGNWTTTFTLVNTGTAPVQASLNFFDNNGNPLPVPLAFPQSGTTTGSPVSTATVTVNPGAGQLVQTAGLASQPTEVGWTQLLANGNLGGFAVFQQTNGASVQEAVVPLENLNPTAFVIWFDNTGGNATGIALANTAEQAASVPVVIRADTGAILQSTTIQLAADGHTSFDVASTYALASGIRGTVEFETPAGDQISVLGIAFSPTGAFSTIPALATGASPSTLGSMAQLAFAGGWTTTFTLVNTGTAPAQASLDFFAGNGIPLSVPLVFPQSGATAGPESTATLTLNPGAGQLIQTAGSANLPTQEGWTQLLATGSLSGFAAFQQANGTSIQEAVVPLETRNPMGFVIWYDNTGGNTTGIALANTSGQAGSIPVVIRDDTGAILQSTTIQLAADGYTSFDLASAYTPAAGVRGTVEFDTPAGGQISVLGIQFSPTGAFSTIPALTK